MVTRNEKDDVGPTPRPTQFNLRHILLLFVALGALLALVTQLRHVGFFAFCFISAAATGWWLRNWRLMTAGLTAISVFVITYLACWVQLGYGPRMHRWPTLYGSYHFEPIHEALSKYDREKGGFPDSLSDLADLEGHNLPFDESGEMMWGDGWNRPLHYEKTPDGFRLGSLGRDGVAGGVGLDADIFLGDKPIGPQTRLPPKQFLFETEGSGGVFMAAVLASFAAGCIWFGGPAKEQLRVRSLIVGVTAATVSAVLVAIFLAAFYVAVSQSGH